MANECHNFMIIKRIDWWKLTDEEIWAFIRKEDSSEWQWTEVDIDWEKYFFSYQFVVPVKQDDNWRDNNINNWGTKRDGWYYAYVKLSDTEMTIHFTTPWWPPNKWCNAVCKKYKELNIRLEYDEPLMWFQGEMWRDENWKLFDNYREAWDYLVWCDDCWIGQEETNISYRDDVDALLCDACYQELLNHNPPKKWGK